MLSFRNILSSFWARHPGLLYGVATLTGASYALAFIPPLFPVAFLAVLTISIYFSYRQTAQLAWRLALALILGITTYAMTQQLYRLPDPSQTEFEGTAAFAVTSISTSKIPFQKAWAYKGVLHSLTPHSQKNTSSSVAANIPIHILVPQGSDLDQRPTASLHYQTQARLKKLSDGRYSLTPVKNSEWTATKKAWNLVEWRLEAKAALAGYIQENIKDPHIASFLTGIATGDFNDRLLSYELSRFGLQHLMAISGLHFAIIASILGFFLRLIFPLRTAAVLLIAALSGYFIFLGDSPSVVRAWIAIIIALTALLIERQSAALNSLGLALLFMAVWDPFAALHIGFQFSFAVTASILLWFPFFNRLLENVFPKRPLNQAICMGWLDRHGYCLLFFFRQALALGIAVNLTALPLTLFHFQKFPMLGLVYNLFFPFLISFSLLLLLLAMPLSLISPWLAHLVHAINERYTHFVLDFTFKLPKAFDMVVYSPPFPAEGLILYLTLTFLLGVAANGRLKSAYSPIASSNRS